MLFIIRWISILSLGLLAFLGAIYYGLNWWSHQTLSLQQQATALQEKSIPLSPLRAGIRTSAPLLEPLIDPVLTQLPKLLSPGSDTQYQPPSNPQENYVTLTPPLSQHVTLTHQGGFMGLKISHFQPTDPQANATPHAKTQAALTHWMVIQTPLAQLAQGAFNQIDNPQLLALASQKIKESNPNSPLSFEPFKLIQQKTITRQGQQGQLKQLAGTVVYTPQTMRPLPPQHIELEIDLFKPDKHPEMLVISLKPMAASNTLSTVQLAAGIQALQ